MKRLLALPLALAAGLAGGAVRRIQDACGPFIDVSPLYCPYVLEAYYTGITAGTSPTTFSPDTPITRAQSAVFTTKALNQALSRGSRRAALGQWWTTSSLAIGRTPVAAMGVATDGVDVWTASNDAGTVSRVQASDGRVLGTWAVANQTAPLAAMGRIFVAGGLKLSMIDPAAGTVTTAADGLGEQPQGLAFDGSRIWVTDLSNQGNNSIFIVTPGPTLPWSVTTVTGFSAPRGIVWDGNSMWVTDLAASPAGAGALDRLDSAGAVLQSVPLDHAGISAAFDGQNLWVASSNGVDADVAVVQASTGTLLATLPMPDQIDASLTAVAFDGRRIAVTESVNTRLLLWNAADLTFTGSVNLGGPTFGVCSDGINFWIGGHDQLLRF